MTCAAVRDRLPEHALGVLGTDDVAPLERHLAVCAACRKEAGELQRAGATLAFALAPAEAPADLEERIVATVTRRAAGGTVVPAPRRGRLAVAAAIAAMLALSGLGWGAVMAGRAARFEQRAEQAADHKVDTITRIQTIFRELEFSDGRAAAGELATVGEGVGGGAAMTVTSNSIDDVAIVLVSGLRPAGAPYSVQLTGRAGRVVVLGRIRHLDADGGAELVRRVRRDLERLDRLLVRDAEGTIVLRGMLSTEAGFTTPTPPPEPPLP